MCSLPRNIKRQCQLFGTLLLVIAARDSFQRFRDENSARETEATYQPAVNSYDPANSVFALKLLVGKRIAPDNNFAVFDLQNPTARELPHWMRHEKLVLDCVLLFEVAQQVGWRASRFPRGGRSGLHHRDGRNRRHRARLAQGWPFGLRLLLF